jgi:hypothetical protein
MLLIDSGKSAGNKTLTSTLRKTKRVRPDTHQIDADAALVVNPHVNLAVIVRVQACMSHSAH